MGGEPYQELELSEYTRDGIDVKSHERLEVIFTPIYLYSY